MRTPLLLAAAILALLLIAVLAADRGPDTLGDPTEPGMGVSPPIGAVEAESTHRAALLAREFTTEAEAALAHYNLGTALLVQERFGEARPHLQQAVEIAGEHRSLAAYNLGNTDLAPAFADSTLADREPRLRRAIEAYKQALLLAPADHDAKWNLELARRLLEPRSPPPRGGEGGGDGGGGAGEPQAGERQPAPAPADRAGPEPDVAEAEAEELLRSARERELQLQRESLRRPQPPGPIRP